MSSNFNRSFKKSHKETRDLMKKIQGIDKETKIYLQALWDFLLGLEKAFENGNFEKAEDYIFTSQDCLEKLGELVEEHIDLYEPSKAYKLGKHSWAYYSLLTLIKTKLERKEDFKRDLEHAQDLLSSITRIILGEEDETD